MNGCQNHRITDLGVQQLYLGLWRVYSQKMILNEENFFTLDSATLDLLSLDQKQNQKCPLIGLAGLDPGL